MPRLISHGFTLSLVGLIAWFLLFAQIACSSGTREEAWVIGEWKGVISKSCSDSDEVVLTDSIFLRFGPERKVEMRKSGTQPFMKSTYFTTEDEVVLESLFGSVERRLNVEGGNGDTLELGIGEGGCFQLFTLVHVDSLRYH
ncbi:MAG: hypothetical protein R2811_05905 [Flavobacteriales bacterium]